MLIELLRQAALAAPDQPLVLDPAGALTNAECLDQADELARGVAHAGISRAGCVLESVRDMLPLLCATAAVGVEACMYPHGIDDASVATLAGLLGHDAVVTDRPQLRGPFTPWMLSELRGTGTTSPIPARPQASPLTILTTGTTGQPRGVRYDWDRLIAAARHTDPEPGTRWLQGYNVNQFAGVQILLHVLSSAATLVVGRSNRPAAAIDAIHDHRVTHVSATPTFWRLLIGMLDRDSAAGLPLTQITLGGEAVSQRLLDDLAELFPSARVSHIYAATEFGVGISVRDGLAGLPLPVLDRDDDAPVRLRIVDGELQVRSTVGMIGYHGEPHVGAEWRSTGDLVEVRDERIHFVGRRSEVVNVGGVKVHPRPIEEAIDDIPGIELVRAYGRPSPLTGSILAVDVVPVPGADTAALEAAIREACEHMIPAAQPRRIRFVDELPVEGHKVRRGNAR